MKVLLLIGLLLFADHSFSQSVCPCCTNPIETSAVTKPTDPDVLSATCNKLIVKWKGNAGQSYVVSGTYQDPSTNTVKLLADPVSTTIDDYNNCTATIPVVAGSTVRWNVKAIQQIDERTFSSYPLRGDQDYLIPSCDQLVATEGAAASGAAKEQLVVSNEKLAMYPNPVNDALNIKLISEYKGSVKLTIIDVSGKTVITMNAEKQQSDYYNRISVNTLKPGVYFMNVYMQNGKSFTTKFLKN